MDFYFFETFRREVIRLYQEQAYRVQCRIQEEREIAELEKMWRQE